MRAGLLAFIVLAGSAVAQVPDVPLAELRAEDPPLVLPLQGTVIANLTLRVSCALLDERGGIPIAYQVTSAPAWATVVVSPASDAADVRNCDGGFVQRDAVLNLAASDMAPAFRRELVHVQATAGPEGRNATANATVNLTADYFSILDVQLAESSKVAPPGGEVGFAVSLANLGNARTRVRFEVDEATDDLTVHPIEPLVLESRQQGSAEHAGNVTVRIKTAEGGAYVNRVGTATIRVVAEHADAPPRAGDQTTVSFIVTTRTGAAEEGENDAPLPPALALAALALAAVARGLRRR